MKIFTNLDNAEHIQATVIALGNFDGVHMGHRDLIRQAVNYAKDSGLRAAVFTFSNHPRELISGDRVQNITPSYEKAAIIKKLGVDYIFNVEFTEEIHMMSPEDFINKILIEKMRMRHAFCGFNYRFGFQAAGTSQTLYDMGAASGFGVNILDPYKIEGHVVSSSLIRKLVADGRVEECEKYLGRHYAESGTVQLGNKIGKSFGFPTCNTYPCECMITPPNGVYITFCIHDGVRYPAITNIGVKPTIGDDYRKNMETHIFNFNKEVYGETVRIEFIKKMRDEIKFGTREELIAQIESDSAEALEYHRNTENIIE